MAIFINAPVVTREKSSIENFYGRVTPELYLDGCCLFVKVFFYVSKEAYSLGGSPILESYKKMFSYDRAVDGPDILTVAHNKVIEEWTIDQVYNAEDLSIVDL